MAKAKGEKTQAGKAKPRPAKTGLSGKEGRDGKGKFVAGNKYASGNANNKRASEFRRRFLDATTPAIFKQAYKALVALIGEGDMVAIKFFFEQVMGKATNHVEVQAGDAGKTPTEFTFRMIQAEAKGDGG